MVFKHLGDQCLAKSHLLLVTRIPVDEVGRSGKVRNAQGTLYSERNLRNKVLIPKHLVHHRPHPVDVFVPNLNEHRPALGQQIPRLTSSRLAAASKPEIQSLAASVFSSASFLSDPVSFSASPDAGFSR